MFKHQQVEESSFTATCYSSTCHEITSEEDLSDEREIRVINYDKYFRRQSNIRKQEKPLNLEKRLSRTLNNLINNKSNVELILEVEMVKPNFKSSFYKKNSNSLVEVTVIHTNKSDNFKNKKMETGRKTFPFKEIKKSESETGSMKRRKWFDRIINNYIPKSGNDGKLNKHNGNTDEGANEQSENKHSVLQNYSYTDNDNSVDCGKINSCKQQSYKNGTCLADQMNHKRKVKRKKMHTINKKTHNHIHYLEKQTISSKINKIRKVGETLDSLKNEINSKTDIKNDYPLVTKGYVYKLGKVVNNILTDIMEKPQLNVRENDKITISSYFEAVMSNSELINNKNGATSKSRNCTLTHIENNIDKQVINSNTHKNIMSIPDRDKDAYVNTDLISHGKHTSVTNKYQDVKCTESNKEPMWKDAHVQVESTDILGTKENKLINSKFCKIVNSQLTSKEHIHKSKFTVRNNISHHHLVSQKKQYRKTERKINNHGNMDHEYGNNLEYLWMWDGKKLGICFDLKKRIETLIIKELQNLALKRSFEYSISQVGENLKLKEPSTSVTFLCHLDVSDTKINRVSRTINKNHVHYNSMNIHTKLNTSRKINGSSKYGYKESKGSPSISLKTDSSKDQTELTATHTHLVPDVQHRYMEMKNNRRLAKTTDAINVGNHFSHLNEHSEYNSMPLAELPLKKTFKCLSSDKLNCPPKRNHVKDIKQSRHKHITDKLENVEIKYLNANWTPESENISDVNMCMKEEKHLPNNLDENKKRAEPNLSKHQLVPMKHNKSKTKKILKVVKDDINSDESLWNGFKNFVKKNIHFDHTLHKKSHHKIIKTYSKETNNTQSTVEIELDLKNFESILEKTKRNKQKAEQASQNKGQKHKYNIPPVNSDEYTKRLLKETGKKLEEYIKGKEHCKIKERKAEI